MAVVETVRKQVGRVTALIREKKHAYIAEQLGPQTMERKHFENAMWQQIAYYSSPETIRELEGQGKKFIVADAEGSSFTVQTNSEANNGTSYDIFREQGDSQSNAKVRKSSTHVEYNDKRELQSVVFVAEDGKEIHIDKGPQEKSWITTHISTENLTGISAAKEEMESKSREMERFLKLFYKSHLPVIHELPSSLTGQNSLILGFRRTRDENMNIRLFLGENSRRRFIRGGVLLVGALLLAACAPALTASPGSESSASFLTAHPDWRELVDSGAYAEPAYQEVIRAERENLGPGAKLTLAAFLASKAGESMLETGWQEVTTPSFMLDRGLVKTADIANSKIFRFTQRNGGYLFHDSATGNYFKLAVEGNVNDYAYLQQAASNYRNGWAAAGVPQEVIDKVLLVDGFQYEGQNAILLSTPDMGTTLESYTKFLQASKGVNANAELAKLMERYYIETLLPMNAVGVYQKDPNFKNICLFQNGGETKLVPIDLNSKPLAFEKGAIFQTQYEELASRSLSRGITMPSYAEFLQNNPTVSNQLGLIAEMGKMKTITLSIPGQAAKVSLMLPEAAIGGPQQGEVMTKLVQSLEVQYMEEFKSMPQGTLKTFEVTLETGEMSRVVVMKANAMGDAVKLFGGDWGEILKMAKQGVKFTADALFVMWIASELGEIVDPDYRVVLESDIAFPDSVSWTDNAWVFLDTIHARLMHAKTMLAARTAGSPQLMTPVAEQMFGMTSLDILDLITKGFMSQAEIGQVMLDMAEKAAFPPAQSEVKFQSPVPILLDGAEEPMSAMFSAFNDEDGKQVILFWAQTQNIDGKYVTMPVSGFSKYPSDKQWEMTPIVEKPWTLEFQAHGNSMGVLTCTESKSDGSKFEIQCFEKPQP